MGKKDDHKKLNKSNFKDREYTEEDYEIIRQDTKNILNDTERMLAKTEAQMTVYKKKKYMFMISNEMIKFLAVIGGFVLFATIIYVSDCIAVRHNTKAAVKAVCVVAAIIGLFIFWILKSNKLKKEFDSDVEKALISGDYEHVFTAPTQKKAKDVELKYRVERIEKLSQNELLEAIEEWESLNDIITDSFYRLFPAYYSCINNNKLYQLLIEIRYENGYPDSESLKLFEERVCEDISYIEDFDLSRQMFRFKERIKEIVSLNFSRYVKDIRLKEVCVAVVFAN